MAKYIPSFEDLLIIAGLFMLAIGLWMHSPKLMLLVIGTILLLMGLAAAWRRGGG